MLKVNSGETRWLLLPPGRAIRGIYTLVTTRRHDHTAKCYTRSDTNSPTWKLNKSQMWPRQPTAAFREEKLEQKGEGTVRVMCVMCKMHQFKCCPSDNRWHVVKLQSVGKPIQKVQLSPLLYLQTFVTLWLHNVFTHLSRANQTKGPEQNQYVHLPHKHANHSLTSSIWSLPLSSQWRQKEMLSLFIQVKANLVHNASAATATHLHPSTESRTAKVNTMIKVTLCGSGHLGWLTGRNYSSLGGRDKNLKS